MTLLASLSGALTSLDRTLIGLRSMRAGGMFATLSHDPPIVLSGQQRVISYADSVATHPVVFAVWAKLLRNLATTDIGVFRIEDDRRLSRVHGTDLERLLREPAPGRGLLDLLQWLFNPYFVEGNGLIGKVRVGAGPPVAFVPLDWRTMSALAVAGGPVEYWISYLLGEPRALAPSDVLHMAWAAPSGSAIGPSPLRALGTTIRRADALQRYQESSMDNAARPSGVLMFPEGYSPSPHAIAENRAQVEAMHKGVDNAFKLAALYGGAEWRPMSHTAVEAELIDSLRVTHDEVCIAYDVKRSVIAESAQAGGRQVAEVLRDFERTLRPHVTLAEQMFQRQLIDPEPAWRDERFTVRFDLSDLLRGTFREEVETAVHAYVNGLWSEDEGRARLALEPSGNDGSNVPRVPYAQLAPGVDGRTLPPAAPGDGNRARNRSGAAI